MKKVLLIILLVIVLLLILGGSCVLYHIRDRHSGYNLDLKMPTEPAKAGQFQIGLAKQPITPNIEDTWVDVDSNAKYEPIKGDYFIDKNDNGKFDAFWLAGFHQNRPATGVHDDLWARAVVFDDGNFRVALVVLDVIGLFHDDVITIRLMTAEKGLGIDHVIVSSTHVHEAPDLMGLWGPKFYKSGVNKDYLEYVQRQAAEAVQLATENRRPAYIKLAKIDSTASDLVRDSRPPFILDDAIHLMQFCDAQTDSTFGLLMNWGNHPETLDDHNLLITADFCHYWLEGLEHGISYNGDLKRQGIGGTAIFANGAVGGLMTTLGCTVHDPWLNKDFKEASFAKARAQGFRLADLVLNAIEQAEWERVENPLMQLRAKTFRFKVQNKFFKLAAILGLFERGFIRLNYIRSEINLLTIGDAWLLNIPGEINPEIVNGGIESPEGADFPGDPIEVPPLRKLMRGKYNFVIGLANDEVGYIMPKTHWDTLPPYTYGAITPFYGEINSVGPEAGPTTHREAKEIIESFLSIATRK